MSSEDHSLLDYKLEADLFDPTWFSYRTFPKVRPRQKDAEAMTESLLVWESAISTLNPEIAIKITSKVVHAIMARL